jgi:phosphoinositide-3-kinase regulatory subunit 4
MVKSFPPSESNVFSEYILPALSPVLRDPDEWVRVVYAENLALLAEIAKKFLEISQVILLLASYLLFFLVQLVLFENLSLAL